MPSTSPFGMSIAGMRATSPDTSSFNTKHLLESLGTPDAAINTSADSIFGNQSPWPSSTPEKDKPTGDGSANSGVSGAEDSEDHLDEAEKRLWDEVKETIATFG